VWVGGDYGGDLINVLCKPIWNCHSDSSLYYEYILIKMEKKMKIIKISNIKYFSLASHVF
jgi:hypothetical protein